MSGLDNLVAAALRGCVADFATIEAPTDFEFLSDQDGVWQTPLTVADGAAQFNLPALSIDAWDTVLLRVEVAARGERCPYVEISSGACRQRQHFASGDAGWRWLNLSGLRGHAAPGALVCMTGHGMKLKPGNATLRIFANELGLSQPILVIAPHPDDAEIAAFGLYSDRNATILTVTAGNGGPTTYEAVFDDMAMHYRFKGWLRAIDSVTVPWQGGISPERCLNLGYFDGQLAEMRSRPGVPVSERFAENTDVSVYRRANLTSLLPAGPRECTWNHLVEDIRHTIALTNPRIIVAPHPQLDAHPDHQLTTLALLEALEGRIDGMTLFLYTNHADGNRHPYGPSGTVVSLPVLDLGRVVLDRVYSHPLSEELQRRKLFAIESMHDVRLSPMRQYQVAVGDDRAGAVEARGPDPYITYLRRGPRSNELFYVYDLTTVHRVIDRLRPSLRPADLS